MNEITLKLSEQEAGAILQIFTAARQMGTMDDTRVVLHLHDKVRAAIEESKQPKEEAAETDS